ncbi:MAG: membrane protein insertion efficiency factor YidD [Gammaproteobacteria bacterium]|nr:membrane protein insertion efficiency factor YidD [Gammaproteobacteria bacterium]
MSKPFILLIRVYRYILSPLLGTNCRFYPSCSSYAETALSRYGLFKGGWLSLCRVARCHPWHHGGVDPVPEKTKKVTNG